MSDEDRNNWDENGLMMELTRRELEFWAHKVIEKSFGVKTDTWINNLGEIVLSPENKDAVPMGTGTLAKIEDKTDTNLTFTMHSNGELRLKIEDIDL